MAEFPPRVGSSWGDSLQRCGDMSGFAEEGGCEGGHGCMGGRGGPACGESGRNALLEDGWCLFCLRETRSALGTVRLDSGHLFFGSTPLSPAAGV